MMPQHPQQQHQQWPMMQPAPQQQQPQPAYYQPPAPPMWNPQTSHVPPPIPMPMPTPYQAPAMPSQPVAGSGEIRTLWIGDLQYWMDENHLYSYFGQTGEVASAKVIRNKQTQLSEGYGFIEFVTRAAAERVLQTYNGQIMPNTEQVFRLNWATCGAGERRGDDGSDYTIFVGDLAADVTDYLLQETFKSRYPSVKGAKVVTDRITQRSKGYGFVKFGDVNEQTRAMTEMNGVYCSTRPMRVGAAANKKGLGSQYSANASYQTTQGNESDNDPNNTTIFVGGLDSNISDDYLRQVFAPYGELVSVKIPLGKRCGFVQFVNRANAEEALKMLNGTQLGGQNIRLSWGRSPANKQDPNQWNGNYYTYTQGYDSYGYAPPQDPNMYAYSAYPNYNYQQPQQQQQQPTQ